MPPSAQCIGAVKAASNGKLTDDEVIDVFEAVNKAKKRIEAETGMFARDDALRAAVEAEGERTQILAAMQRKHAALNAIVRDKLESTVDKLRGQGMSAADSIRSLMEGSNQGVALGRFSVDYQMRAYQGRFLGDLHGKVLREKPHIRKLLGDQHLMDDAVREMWELREGGTPGLTKNADAVWLAKALATAMEVSRQDLRRLGGLIGKLDGYAGPQAHDDVLVMGAGQDKWVSDIYNLLDVERSFPDVAGDRAKTQEVLADVYMTIVTGRSNRITGAERGERYAPSNLANLLGRHRVLHFKSADAWLTYRDQYGYGNLWDSVTKHQMNAARTAAQMEVFGPNPEVMLKSLAEGLQRKIRNDPKLTDAAKSQQIGELQLGPYGFQGGPLADAYLEMNGFTTSTPIAETTMARIMGTARAGMAAARMGSAVITALPGDQALAANAALYRGTGYWRTIARQLETLMKGRRDKSEAAIVAHVYDATLSGMRGHVLSPFLQHDLVPGMAARAAEATYRWSGFVWETDITRKGIASGVAAEIGARASKTWADLNIRFQHVLKENGIGASEWDAIRAGVYQAADGHSYVTPDRIASLPDQHFAPLVDAKLASIPAEKRTAPLRQRFTDQARLDVEMALRRYVIDQTNLGNPIMDARGRRVLYRGTRPGTVAGTVMRSIVQFKGFTFLTFNGVAMREMHAPGSTKAGRILAGAGNFGALLAGLTTAGYASMVARDFITGRWPPRDPTDHKTVLAAIAQGGGLGLYGDYLFGGVNRYGNTPLESLAGPLFGELSNVIQLYWKVRNGDAKSADVFNMAIRNVPFANLWWSRAAMDFLWINAMREALTPGYMARKTRGLKRDYKQNYVVPPGPMERPGLR